MSALEGFIILINELDSGTIDLLLEGLVDHTIKTSGLLQYHKNEKGEKGQARVENLEELVSAAKQFVSEDDDRSPQQQFLDRAALDAGDAQADEHEDSVQLMTLHSAKGLEFPLVFLAGMEENLFPQPNVYGGAGAPGRGAQAVLRGNHPSDEKTHHHLCRMPTLARQRNL